jgi:tRNA nucleotidyltransferase (CCA-adding enzyme)
LVDLWVRVGAAARWIPELEAVPPARLDRVRDPGTETRDPVLLTMLLVDDAAQLLRRLRASNSEIERAAAVARGPGAPSGADVRAVRHWLAATGRAADDLLALETLRTGADAPWAASVHQIRQRGEPLTRGDLALSGSDLQALGATGPRIGEVLAALLAQVLDEPARNDRDTLLALARELL